MKRRRTTALALAGVLLLASAACGGGDKVGEAFEDFEGEKGGDRIGEIASTPKPKASKAPAAAKKAATPAPQQTTKPAAAKQSVVDVKINKDGFDPTTARVTQGSTVKVTNVDAAPHTYTSSDATYDTGSVAPGQSKTFVASSAGTFQMEDRTRNWIIGSLEVSPQ